MHTYFGRLSRQRLALGALIAILAIGAATWQWWSQPLTSRLNTRGDAGGSSVHDHEGHEHEGHDHEGHDHEGHDHEGHDHEGHEHGDHQHDIPGHGQAVQVHGDSPLRMAIELTPQARENLGLTAEYLKPLAPTTYRRSITLPAVIVPKPGRSQLVVASPLSGIVTHVHAVDGQAVMPGELLMEVKLTYEDLVESQAEYLKSISELQVENREITRLEEATRSGAVSGKSLLERRYAKDKLEASLRAQREALRMHGLSERQVDAIATEGRLLQELQIVAPDIDRHSHDEELHLSNVRPGGASFPAMVRTQSKPTTEVHRPLVVDGLQVQKGQAVSAGDKLCSLSDYSELFIEGKAFEQDAAAINQAVQRDWSVDAVFTSSTGTERVEGLELVFVSNAIDPASRTLSLYVDLPNSIIRDETNAEGQRYIYWKYRIGQRLEVQVPVELWENQFVLPIDAVVKEGAEWFVFQQNGSRFDRVPVHVRHRDQRSVVIANDGSIDTGDVIALKGAHQLQMAIQNNSGSKADPHAGHSH